MKLSMICEQGHWETIYHPGHMDPKMRQKKSKQDLSFRIKGQKNIGVQKPRPKSKPKK